MLYSGSALRDVTRLITANIQYLLNSFRPAITSPPRSAYHSPTHPPCIHIWSFHTIRTWSAPSPLSTPI